ncbi:MULTISPECIES: LysR family transcriptional regulator [Acinetobacter]|uniref:LysR family transcriptional regulator n=1 Tax=Acinetobacter rongchengensis TaxID=2419601 RepID=A0A3A8EJM6_9GAMM|nr:MULTISPECIES: LysR family transcriptional regulator [Acinetobacter]RKG34319.1 LysR family transcriptional regulator [Acinetobacter rongchengensis]CEI53495.1 Transcriptional regulator, LysR family [Acinetobacter bereziniae]
MNSDTELAFFCLLIKQGSLVATARELNLTPPAVSRRLTQMEERLGVRLLNRTTRRISLTHEGEIYYENALRILKEIEDMERRVSSTRFAPKGLIRINAPLGFGRSYIALAISDFAKIYPEVKFQLQLSDRPVNLPDEAIDVVIRFGEIPDSRLIAQKLAANRRLLCASPLYLKSVGIPKTPHDLTAHQCIVIRQNEAAYGNWRLSLGEQVETIKVHGNLSTNDGEVALNWALDGQGILMRAEWDVAKYLRSGRLIQVLEQYNTPSADVYAVYLERLQDSPRVAYFLNHLKEYLAQHVDNLVQHRRLA